MNRNFHKGFTLIELIVVMAVFLLIIGGAVGIFISIIGSQRRLLYEQELLNQTSYIEEHISKALRVATKDVAGNCLIDTSPSSPNPLQNYPGYNFLLTRPGADGFFTGVKFLNQSDTDYLGRPICQEFFLDNAISGDLSAPLVVKELKNSWPYSKIGDEKAVALSSDKLLINKIRFGIDGYNGKFAAGYPVGDQQNSDPDLTSFQPRITILLNINIKGDTENPIRIIQTSVSQRNLNAQ